VGAGTKPFVPAKPWSRPIRHLQKLAHSLAGIGDASKFNLLDLDLAAHDLSGMPRATHGSHRSISSLMARVQMSEPLRAASF
jgi:hypothetical protein